MPARARRRPGPVRAAPRAETRPARELDRSRIALWLFGLAAASTTVRLLLVATLDAPSVFMDELGYEQLARSLGQDGRLALFGNEGLSYPPLYSLVLAPIYAFESLPAAFEWAKAVNAVLMSTSVFPAYFIARFALSARHSVLAAGLCAAAPLMLHTSFVLAENLAYPLALLAIWALLSTVSSPTAWRDTALLAAIVAAAAARVELLVLLPAALTAFALAAALAPGRAGFRSVLVREARHIIVLAGAAVTAAGTVVYAAADPPELPSVFGFFEQLLRHAATLELAVGVVPFVGAGVAGYAFLRFDRERKYRAFAAVAVSVTGWLLLEVAALGRAAPDAPLHERHLIYAVPLFVIAALATIRLADADPWPRVSLLAVVPAALLPAVIPFDRAIDLTNVADTLGLQPFARLQDGDLEPVPHVVPLAIATCTLSGLAYGVVRRTGTRALTALVLIAFVYIGFQARSQIGSASDANRIALPWHRDWVDRAISENDVVLVATDRPRRSPSASVQTAFFNASIARIYTVCGRTFGAEFGEQPARVGPGDRLTGSTGPVRARYAVVPDAWEVTGDVLSTNARGGDVLVRLPRPVVHVRARGRERVDCT